MNDQLQTQNHFKNKISSKGILHSKHLILTIILSVSITLIGCESDSVSSEPDDPVEELFEEWSQVFDQGTEGWTTAGIEGADGWCGEIERIPEVNSDIEPSAGEAIAAVRHSACNDFYSESFPDGSGPASALMTHNEVFPEQGFISEVDIYLDPEWQSDLPFVYSNSFQVLDEEWPNFRYFMHDVTMEDGELLIDGHIVPEAGWYTFRHRFMQIEGELNVDFEVLQDGDVLFSEPVPVALHFTEEAEDGVEVLETSSFEADNVSNAYIWFVAITVEELAIDNQHLHLP